MLALSKHSLLRGREAFVHQVTMTLTALVFSVSCLLVTREAAIVRWGGEVGDEEAL